MPYRLATPQRSPFSVIHFPRSVKPFYVKAKILIVFFGKSAIVSDVANAPVAQLDRVSVSEAEGRGFESRRARQLEKIPFLGIFLLGQNGVEKKPRQVGSVSVSERRRQAVPSGTKSEAMSNPAGRTNLKKILERGFFVGAKRRGEEARRCSP